MLAYVEFKERQSRGRFNGSRKTSAPFPLPSPHPQLTGYQLLTEFLVLRSGNTAATASDVPSSHHAVQGRNGGPSPSWVKKL